MGRLERQPAGRNARPTASPLLGSMWVGYLGVALGSVFLSSCFMGSESGATTTTTTTTTTPQISLRTTSMVVGPAAGTAGAAIVTSENGAAVAWTASTNTSWIHLTDTAGATAALGSVARFTYDANTGDTRTGTIGYQSSAYSGTLTVTQAGVGYVATLPQATTLVTVPSLSAFAVDLAGNVYYVPNYFANTSATLEEWVASTGNTTALSVPAATQCQGMLTEASALYVNNAGTIVGDQSGVCASASTTEAVDYTVQWTEGSLQSNVIDNGTPGLQYYWAGVTPDWMGNSYAALSTEGAGPTTATTSVEADGASGLTSITTIPNYVATGFTGDTNYDLFVTGISTVNSGVSNYTIMNVNATTGAITQVANLGNTITNSLAVDASGNLYFLVQDPAAQSASTYLNYYLAEWSPSAGKLTQLSATGEFAQIYGDGVGDIYAETPQRDIQVFTPVFVDTAVVNEPGHAGSDQLPPVLPNTAQYTAVSDSTWLTVTGQSDGVVSFSFTATTAARTGHITILGQSIPISQAAP